ncbi:MAG: hypothetical protein V3T61_06105 [Acidobacteriota bacterium]
MTRLLISTVLMVSFSTFVRPQEAIDSISGSVEEGIPLHDQRVRQASIRGVILFKFSLSTFHTQKA